MAAGFDPVQVILIGTSVLSLSHVPDLADLTLFRARVYVLRRGGVGV